LIVFSPPVSVLCDSLDDNEQSNTLTCDESDASVHTVTLHDNDNAHNDAQYFEQYNLPPADDMVANDDLICEIGADGVNRVYYELYYDDTVEEFENNSEIETNPPESIETNMVNASGPYEPTPQGIQVTGSEPHSSRRSPVGAIEAYAPHLMPPRDNIAGVLQVDLPQHIPTTSDPPANIDHNRQRPITRSMSRAAAVAEARLCHTLDDDKD
jgi:hypothetical protein